MMNTTQTTRIAHDPRATMSRRHFVESTASVLVAGCFAAASLPGTAQAAPAQEAEAEAEAEGAEGTGGVVESGDTRQTRPAVRQSLSWAKAAVKPLAATIISISRQVWDLPAVGLQEHDAMEVHIRQLHAAGFRIDRQAGGHPTAFVAQWSLGSGGPKVGYLAEYDALPGLGNAAEPRRIAAANGKTDGHGCGHNNLGAGCTGAALALQAIMKQQNLSGTVRLYGCGAEENVGAKVFLVKAGLLDDLDVAVAWHPTPVPVTGTLVTTANRKIRVSWKGRSAHAGNEPWNGRSALDAAELFTHGVNLMREHVEPTARMHYIYEAAGVAPNVVPDDARILLTAREATTPKVDAMVQWIQQIAQGAASATQTTAEFRLELGMAELIPNETLAVRLLEHMRNTPLDWSAAEQSFAKACQKEMGLKESGMATEVLPLIRDFKAGGSSDVADVSWKVPVALFGWPTHPLGVSAHTWVVTACGGMSIGDKASLAAAEIMTAVGVDVLTQPELRQAAKDELTRRLDGRTYHPVLNIDLTDGGPIAGAACKGQGDEFISGVGTP